MQTKQFTQAEIDAYLYKKSEAEIGPHFFHGVYLINLATAKPEHLRASIDSLVFYQQFAATIGGEGTIFHLGSHQGRGLETALDQVVAAINEILDNTPRGVRLILENSAGQGAMVGDTLEELAQILARVGDKSKIGICLDSQHAFASGYDLDSLLAKFDKIIGLKFLKVIHLNDSKSQFTSHVDRHANLGEGQIGAAQLASFVSDPRLQSVPFILEVPGDGDGPRRQDIDILKSWVLK